MRHLLLASLLCFGPLLPGCGLLPKEAAPGLALSTLAGDGPTFFVDAECDGSARWRAMDRIVVIWGRAKGEVGYFDEALGLYQRVQVQNGEDTIWVYNGVLGVKTTVPRGEPLPAWAAKALRPQDVAEIGVTFQPE